MRKYNLKIALYSLIAGLSIWLLDSVIDYFLFYNYSFGEIALTGVPDVEIYVRLLMLAGCLVFGFILTKINLQRSRQKEEIQMLASVVEQSSQEICVFDKNEIVVYTNPAFHKNTGYLPEEINLNTIKVLRSGKHDENFYREIKDKVNRGETWRGLITNKRKDGGLYDCQAVITPIRNQNGEIFKFAAMYRDVTRENQLEQQFHQSQKMESIGLLAGGIAHDFNNLLTVIKGYAELSLSYIDTNSELNVNLTEILSASKRAQGLVRQLLAYSRKQILEMKTTDPNEIIIDMEKMLRRILGEDIELQTELSDDMDMSFADKGKIEQVLLNLAVNAREAMHGGGKLRIETSVEELDYNYTETRIGLNPGRYILIRVSDTGRGIPENIRNKIFDPFFTTKADGKGTGLGLSTVHGIVKQHRGDILVYSEIGKGTTFQIYLPAANYKEVVEEIEKREEKDEIQDGVIVLVEDDLDVLDVTRNMLKSSGHDVYSFNDTDQAVEFAGVYGGKINLLITDVIMPKKNGVELHAEFRKILPDIKVLYISGYSDNILGPHGVLREDINFLGKPFSHDILNRKVKSVLRNS